MIYPIGIQDFEKLRTSGCVYVDKTALIHQLVTTGCYYFLSRPRRFGKSMLLSTLEAYFSGRRELFEGLAMERLEKDWVKYPILHLDLNTEKYETKESLNNVFERTLLKWEHEYGTGAGEVSLSLRFLGVVERAAEKTGQRVVILIDGYDEPLLHIANDQERMKDYSSTLQAFYSVLKTNDRYIKFAFMTGVSEFGKLKMYPDLNNFTNISRDARFHALCGFTGTEMLNTFSAGIDMLAQNLSLTREQCAKRLAQQYGGYHFEKGTESICHPLWAVTSLDRKEWVSFQPLAESVLLQSIKDYGSNHLAADEMFFRLSSGDAAYWQVLPLVLLQYGYLTITDYDPEFHCYTLSVPNKESASQLFKLGINFSTKTRKVEEWKLAE